MHTDQKPDNNPDEPGRPRGSNPVLSYQGVDPKKPPKMSTGCAVMVVLATLALAAILFARFVWLGR